MNLVIKWNRFNNGVPLSMNSIYRGLIWFDRSLILQWSFYHLVQTGLIKFNDKSCFLSQVFLLAAIYRNRMIILSWISSHFSISFNFLQFSSKFYLTILLSNEISTKIWRSNLSTRDNIGEIFQIQISH